jgi:hypothetical protein
MEVNCYEPISDGAWTGGFLFGPEPFHSAEAGRADLSGAETQDSRVESIAAGSGSGNEPEVPVRAKG